MYRTSRHRRVAPPSAQRGALEVGPVPAEELMAAQEMRAQEMRSGAEPQTLGRESKPEAAWQRLADWRREVSPKPGGSAKRRASFFDRSRDCFDHSRDCFFRSRGATGSI